MNIWEINLRVSELKYEFKGILEIYLVLTISNTSGNKEPKNTR